MVGTMYFFIVTFLLVLSSGKVFVAEADTEKDAGWVITAVTVFPVQLLASRINTVYEFAVRPDKVEVAPVMGDQV